MRPPKGFGKNYFSLAAIQAHSASVREHGMGTAARMHTRIYGSCTDDDQEALPEEEITDLLLQEQPEPSPRAAYGHCFSRRRTHAVERRVRLSLRHICRNRNTKTGSSPPSPCFSTLFLLPTILKQGTLL